MQLSQLEVNLFPFTDFAARNCTVGLQHLAPEDTNCNDAMPVESNMRLISEVSNLEQFPRFLHVIWRYIRLSQLESLLLVATANTTISIAKAIFRHSLACVDGQRLQTLNLKFEDWRPSHLL